MMEIISIGLIVMVVAAFGIKASCLDTVGRLWYEGRQLTKELEKAKQEITSLQTIINGERMIRENAMNAKQQKQRLIDSMRNQNQQ